jgi:sugar lactone lactonase YvrE
MRHPFARLAAISSVAVLVITASASAAWQPTSSWRAPSPYGVAVDGRGEIFVTTAPAGDSDGVIRYSARGKQLARWGTTGDQPGQLESPDGIAVDPQGNVVVVDREQRMQTFDRDGRFLGAQPLAVSGSNEVIAFDVDVDRRGDRFVAYNRDLFNGVPSGVARFAAAGPLLANWGEAGGGPGQIETPLGVASDGRGNVYVVDQSNHRVQRYTADGRFVRQWGQLGARPGQFGFPRGIAVDAAGHVFVADGDNDRVQRFTPEGRFVEQIEVPKDGAERVADLDFTPAGELVVVSQSRSSSATVSVLRQLGGGATVTSSTARLRSGRLPLRVRCAAASTCRGTVRIDRVGRASYRIAAGRTATVRIAPSRAGRAVLQRARTVTVRLVPRRGATASAKLPVR